MLYRGFITEVDGDMVNIKNTRTGIVVKQVPAAFSASYITYLIDRHIEDSIDAHSEYMERMRTELTPKQYIDFIHARER